MRTSLPTWDHGSTVARISISCNGSRHESHLSWTSRRNKKKFPVLVVAKDLLGPFESDYSGPSVSSHLVGKTFLY